MISIVTEKIVVRGVASRKVVRVDGIKSSSKFPSEYSDGNPWIGIAAGTLGGIMVFSSNDMVIGADIPETKFQVMLEHIRKSAARAHEIMERVRALELTWTGEETFVI